VIHVSFVGPKGVLNHRGQWLNVAALFPMSLDHE
jgi:hypothetical protein